MLRLSQKVMTQPTYSYKDELSDEPATNFESHHVSNNALRQVAMSQPQILTTTTQAIAIGNKLSDERRRARDGC